MERGEGGRSVGANSTCVRGAPPQRHQSPTHLLTRFHPNPAAFYIGLCIFYFFFVSRDKRRRHVLGQDSVFLFVLKPF